MSHTLPPSHTMPTDITPLNALVAELGEDTVLEMARAFVELVTARRTGATSMQCVQTPPIRPQPSPACTQLIEDRMASATADNLAPLEVAIEVAQVSNGVTSSLLADAVSRLHALRAVNELNG